jgi:hypothetical protein
MEWTIQHNYPSPQIANSWRKCLERSDFATHYVSPEYFHEPFHEGKHPFAVLGWNEGEVVAVLTGLHEKGGIVCGLRTRPQACLVKDVDLNTAATCLAGGLIEEAGSEPLVTVFSWTELQHLFTEGYSHRTEEGVVVLDLRRGPDALFKDFSENRRRNVRKAIKSGVEVALASTSEEFGSYYEIYISWSERKNLPILPFDVIEKALMLSGNRKLFVARFEGRIIAGVIIRTFPGGMIEYAANSSIRESLTLKPNDLLHWRVIEWACREGYKSYSLGGAHLFLRKMGGTIAPVYRYRLDRTLFRRYELRETLEGFGSKIFHKLPENARIGLRRVLGRTGDNE